MHTRKIKFSLDQILTKANRNPETLNRDLETIKHWLKDLQDFPLKPNDRQIVSFLILNRFSLDKTKSSLKMFYAVKTVFPEYYTLLPKDEEMVKFTNAYNLFALPKLSKGLNRIMFGQCVDASNFSVESIFTLILQIHEMRTLGDLALGTEFILDYRNATGEMFARAKPANIMKYLIIVEKVFANRLSVLHFVNISDESKKFLDGVRSKMQPEMSKRILLHDTVEELLEFYSKDLLPVEIGGTLKTIRQLQDEWTRYLQDNNEYLKKVQVIRTDENFKKKLVFDETFQQNFGQIHI